MSFDTVRYVFLWQVSFSYGYLRMVEAAGGEEGTSSQVGNPLLTSRRSFHVVAYILFQKCQVGVLKAQIFPCFGDLHFECCSADILARRNYMLGISTTACYPSRSIRVYVW